MALPSSGQISLSQSRSEMSQSALNSYSLASWAFGYSGGNNIGVGPTNYAPVNILSSGSRWDTSGKKIIISNLSMSAWYGYDHGASIPTGVTGTLYQHADAGGLCYPQTMLPIELGTSNATYSISISGSADYNEYISVIYGKPWAVNGGSSYAGYQDVYQNTGEFTINISFNYNYTYNATSGSKIYVVLWGACP